MRLEAMKRQAGRPSKENGVPLGNAIKLSIKLQGRLSQKFFGGGKIAVAHREGVYRLERWSWKNARDKQGEAAPPKKPR